MGFKLAKTTSFFLFFKWLGFHSRIILSETRVKVLVYKQNYISSQSEMSYIGQPKTKAIKQCDFNLTWKFETNLLEQVLCIKNDKILSRQNKFVFYISNFQYEFSVSTVAQ